MAGSLGWNHLPGPPGQLPAKPGSLTILGFHIEAESQVLLVVQQPAVTGCRDVQHQPALVPRSERLKIQKEQVRLPVDMKEQLTKGRGRTPACILCLPGGPLSEPLPCSALGWPPLVPQFTDNQPWTFYCVHALMGHWLRCGLLGLYSHRGSAEGSRPNPFLVSEVPLLSGKCILGQALPEPRP